ncbi:30S ribosomal protein S4 [Candidatus Uhrbacteria bacterium RIFCSPHIGHO2_02_FULL_60_10]|uniref:Small ribosomal subunit protein uS4 n=1 Tax=Candidatus Uhrbacteria bacterium RIFCSPHIGHO2_02_FULL_60_10 TaxID=1802392 RepID=A0A1F7U5E5_9BACT|nr:MAG: 30S ribosomal protein S4 [Candidatus Uhrbacteria bacterium RIFCSPHIGHO2_02_FULL_60_10]
MARKLGAKCKQCRREGQKLNLKGDRCLTPKCGVARRAFPPGVHGPTARIRLTPYGTQLREKQKAKNIYGLRETQFRNYFNKATRQVGNTANFLVELLEMRLDNAVFRLGFGKSRSSARQLVDHGHVLVNGHKVNIPSFQVKAGDVITIRERAQKSKLIADDMVRIEKHAPPTWLHLEPKILTGKVLGKPEGQDLKQAFNPRLIVEFYSR